MRNRKVGSHEMNMESSRSHSIVTVFCETPACDENDHCARFGKARPTRAACPPWTGSCVQAVTVQCF